MIKPTPNKNSRKKKLKQQHLSLSKQAVVKQKLLSAKADTCTLPGYTDIFFKGYIQMKIPISFNDNSDKKNTLYNLPATGMAIQREIIKVNEQPLIQGNKNAMDAINIVWIVARISRTSQSVILYWTTSWKMMKRTTWKIGNWALPFLLHWIVFFS